MWKRRGGSWVSHVPSRGKLQVRFGLRWPGQTVMGSWPPALLKGEKKEKEKRRSFTSIIDV